MPSNISDANVTEGIFSNLMLHLDIHIKKKPKNVQRF